MKAAIEVLPDLHVEPLGMLPVRLKQSRYVFTSISPSSQKKVIRYFQAMHAVCSGRATKADISYIRKMERIARI